MYLNYHTMNTMIFPLNLQVITSVQFPIIIIHAAASSPLNSTYIST